MSSSTSAVGELDGSLQAMLNLKPPGASGTLVGRITDLCTKNIQVHIDHTQLKYHQPRLLTIRSQSESVLVQKLYTHFKKTPPTHKLGVLYVVDSVTRKWTELAKAEGQTIESAAPDGTYAAGVNRVKELFPVLMNDIVSSAPEDQKVCYNRRDYS
jgi:protein NRD1